MLMHLTHMINKKIVKQEKRLKRYQGYSPVVIAHRLSFSGWETGTHFSSRFVNWICSRFLVIVSRSRLHFELQPLLRNPVKAAFIAHLCQFPRARSTSVVLICTRSRRNLACLASLRICKRRRKLLRRYETSNVFRRLRFRLCFVWISQFNHRAFTEKTLWCVNKENWKFNSISQMIKIKKSDMTDIN